jgi:hypothetical protein
MSHIATNWAFQQRGLKPAAKIVLLVLADCHNPSHGCFPTQAFLAETCEMSRDSVNVHLAQLEAEGLIRRYRSIDPVSKRQRPTRYKLGFELDFGDEAEHANQPTAIKKPVSENPTQVTKAVSEKAGEPCRNHPENRVGNSDTNPVREPLNEPVVRGYADEHTQIAFDAFWKSHPRPRDRERAMALFCEAVADGVSPAWIVASAKAYRDQNEGNKPMYLVYADNWLADERWTDFDAPLTHGHASACKAETAADVAELFAEKIKAGRYVAPSAVTARLASEIVGRGLATEAQMRAAGFRL